MSDNHETEEASEATRVAEESAAAGESPAAVDAASESSPENGEAPAESSLGGEESSEIDELFLSPDDSDGELIEFDEQEATPDEVAEGRDDSAPAESNTAPSAESGTASSADLQQAEDALAESQTALGAARQSLEVVETALGEAEKERDEAKERLIRTAADLENFRKRTLREKEELRKYGIDKVVLELLPVLDNLDRALEHAGKSEDNNSIVDGVRMVQRQFVTALQKHGVQGFDSRGEMFDPQRHEAIQQIETDEHETGTVLEEYQKGYLLHDRLIRPALVVVARKLETAPPADESEEDVVVEVMDDDGVGDGEVPAPEDSATESETDGADEEAVVEDGGGDDAEVDESAVH